MDSRYRQAIIDRLDSQRNKGVNKYGQPLELNRANIDERLEHLAQELTDGLEYIEWIKEHYAEINITNDLIISNKESIFLPKLRQELYASPLAQALQVQEEAGELAEKIGLLTGATGKRKTVPEDIVQQVADEALDVAQAACGVIFSLQMLFSLCVDEAVKEHIRKVKERGYLEIK